MPRPGMLETVTAHDLPGDLMLSDLGLGSEVVVFQINAGDVQAGQGNLVHVETLAQKLAELAPEVNVVVFIDGAAESLDDEMLVQELRAMLAEYANPAEADGKGSDERTVHALVRHSMATEAVKRVEGDLVTAGLDRASLVTVRTPEIIDRSVLERALAAVDDQTWISPTAEVAAVGGVVSLFVGSQLGPDGE